MTFVACPHCGKPINARAGRCKYCGWQHERAVVSSPAIAPPSLGEQAEHRTRRSWPPAPLLGLAWLLAGAVPAAGATVFGQFLEDVLVVLLIASAQTLVLQWARLPSASRWVPASVAGTLGAGIAVYLLFSLLAPLLDALLGGPGRLGPLLWGGVWGGGALAQALVLAHGLGRSRHAVALVWVPAGTVGGVLFTGAASGSGGFLFQLGDVWTVAGAAQQLASHLLAWGTGGTLYGLVTGAALLWLLRAHAR